MSETTNHNRANSLIKALEKINLHGEYGEDRTRQRHSFYVTVWTPDDTRYPSATVWVDDEGYTWGHSFEHSRNEHVATTVVAGAIKDSLEGVSP